LSAKIPHEFRTTCINPLIDHAVVERIARLIEGADLYALQQFHTTQVLDPVYCQESGRRYDTETLETFQTIAAPWVRRCIVR
jgi:pyruvate formate lyase activating enzyme